MSEQFKAPPVFRPRQIDAPGVQLKPAALFRVETRPAPPVYRPLHPGKGVQLRPNGSLETKPPLTGNGRRKIQTEGSHAPGVSIVGRSTSPSVQMSKSYGKHGQLPGRLSNLDGQASEAASKALHGWKQSKGMKGDSVTLKEQLKEMEWSIVLSLVTRYGRELYEAGYTKQQLQIARFQLMSPEDQEWFKLPEVKAGPPRKKEWEGNPDSIRSQAKRLGKTRREIRAMRNV